MMKKLVFIGGGHSHAIALKKWSEKPLANTQLILVSNGEKTPYSGMLPAHIAGFYSYEEIHINLINLATIAQAELILDECIGIDLENKQVICKYHPHLDFDYVSINIGSNPDQSLIQGAEAYATKVKPVPQFLAKWSQILQQIKANYLEFSQQHPLNLALIGGGAGGVELALNIQAHLTQLLSKNCFQISLFQRNSQLLPQHNSYVRNRLKQLLLQAEIKLYLGENVTQITPQQIICHSGLKVNYQHIFLVTQASSPDWVKNSGLKTDEKGFILVNSYLQSVSHPFVFAVGDIATMVDYPRPKAGVFAVRQGKPLFHNLQSMIQGQPLTPNRPQSRILALIGTGNKQAIASWGGLGCQSPLLWKWKDYIDQKFMRQFQERN